MKTGRVEILAPYSIGFVAREAPGAKASGPARRLILLLHGYSQTGERIFSKLEPVMPAEAAVVAPNGLFPVPKRPVGFSWYFYDSANDEYVVDMRPATVALGEMVRALGFEGAPTTLIGFSQGGYLAPFLAQALPQVDQVIGIGARYLVDELSGPYRFRADAVHGDQDSVVDPLLSRQDHARLTKLGVPGEFHLVPGCGHRLGPELIERCRSVTIKS